MLPGLTRAGVQGLGFRVPGLTRGGVQARESARQLQAGQPQCPKRSPRLQRSQLSREPTSFPATRSRKGPSLPCQLHSSPECQVCTSMRS